MADFVIVADTGCDLGTDLQERFGIEILKAHLRYPDKTERFSFLSWDDITMEEFYKNLKKDPKGYSTAPASLGEFTECYLKFANEGKGVIYISNSSAISGTYNFACQAKEMALKENPNAKIEIVDSKRFGSGYGLLCVHASMKRAEGLSMEETVNWLNEHKNEMHQAGWLDDLSFVAKSGRMNSGKAFFGTLAGIKPFGEQDNNGKVTVIGKAKGAKSGYAAIIGYMKDTIIDAENQIVFIANSNRRKQAEELKVMVENEIHPKEVYVKDVFPTTGINCGPGLMSAYYMGTPITDDLKKETAILEKYLGK